ncbi:hypothetical protein [Polyangium aurulentum]|uniref:hypothetical protein n=1 Tax=Polyangium aurulentum TaxID=2567896 RepID=UPI0010AEB420|nr:hypothetical protein [Polyangium aurulentum]UQA55819.1 hypothetical protein E8A73_031385 [Polyangium aurulentum]
MLDRLRSLAWIVAVASLAACDKDPPVATGALPSASGPAAPPPLGSYIAPAPTTAPAARVPTPNPLGLPPRQVKLDAGRRVFTFAEPMLAGAKLGSTLVLYAATVAGFDGDDLVIEGRDGGPSYKVHAGYVIPVPDGYKPKLNEPILTEWNGVMKHAIIKRYVKDRIAVRYTDMEPRTPEGLLKPGTRMVKQVEGLAPGNYAAARQDGEHKHVLLVSPIEGSPRRWFCLGFGGAATIVDEPDLVPIPIKWKGKAGANVWAEWAGTMRRAVVQSVDEDGLFTVKFERAGKPVSVGWGLIMDPVAEP